MQAALLARKRRRAAAMLWTERLVPALGPSAAMVLAWLCAALLGLLSRPRVAALLLVATALTAAVSAWWGLRQCVRPTEAEIDRRLETNAGVAHRPLATLDDRPAWAGGEAVWQAHRERATRDIAILRPGLPHLGWGASAGLGTGLAILLLCLVVAGPAAPGLLWAALAPHPVLSASPPTQLQAWIVPPRVTGLAPIFLRVGDTGAIAVPPGAQLTVSVTGGHARPELRFGGATQRFRRLGGDGFQADLSLTKSMTLEVWRHGDRVAGWGITVVPDRPPTIALVGVAGSAGTRATQPWIAHDDYGLAAVTAEFRLRERPGAAPLTRELPLDGAPRDAHGSALPDLTADPWAGLPVLLRYVARDGGGQRAVSADVELVLPERGFDNALARALILVRRMLVTDPDDTIAATSELDRLSVGASGQLPLNQWLNLRAIAALLFEQPDDLDQAQTRLWALAVQIEDGGVTDAKQRLAAARAALQDALAAPPGPDRQRQIAALTQQLRQQMLRYLQAMEQQAARNGLASPDSRSQSGEGRSVDAAQLLQMEQQLEQAAKAGRGEEALARLGELGALLDSLRQSNRLAGAGGSGPKPDPAFTQLLQDQQALHAQTSQRLSQDGDPRTTAGPEHDPDEAAGQPDPARQRTSDAAAQAGLRRRLDNLAERLGASTGQVPDGLARADGAMRDAATALGRGDDAGAGAAQQRALDGLRQGGQELAAQQGAGAASPQPASGTDPLGRDLADGASGAGNDDGADVPVNGDAARSRAVRDELRRRAADRTRSQQELNYIDRLLKPD